MRQEWTDRELEGIYQLLRVIGVSIDGPVEINIWMSCHENVIFDKPPGGFTKDEWHALGRKLSEKNLVDHRRDFAWSVNYGRLVKLVRQSLVSIRLRKSTAEYICEILRDDPSEIAWNIRNSIKKELEGKSEGND